MNRKLNMSKVTSHILLLLGTLLGFASCQDFEDVYSTTMSMVTIIGIIVGVIIFIIIAISVIVICCCCMRQSRTRGHVYRQPNAPVTVVTTNTRSVPQQQPMNYLPAQQHYQAYPTYPQSGMVQQSGIVQQSHNVAYTGYPQQVDKAEPSAPPPEALAYPPSGAYPPDQGFSQGQGYPPTGPEKPPPYPGC